MVTFQHAIFDLLSEGQKMSGAERSFINQQIEQFTKDYKEATGKDPQAHFETIYLITPRLEAFGFKLPTVERWRQEDMVTTRCNVERKNIRLGKER